MPLRPMGREQMWMLPPTLDELLPLDHPARFVAEFVDALGRDAWAELGVDIDGEVLGAPAYHPRALLSVWLYGFMTGVRSCRKLEAACRDQIPYLWFCTSWQASEEDILRCSNSSNKMKARRKTERRARCITTTFGPTQTVCRGLVQGKKRRDGHPCALTSGCNNQGKQENETEREFRCR